jgi:hypothetical protein
MLSRFFKTTVIKPGLVLPFKRANFYTRTSDDSFALLHRSDLL